MEWEFFERYKVLEGPWPWKEDPDGWWNHLFPRSCAIYFFNMLLIGPATYGLHEYFDEPIPFDVSRDGVPNSAVFVAQILWCIMVEDFSFHMSHRVLHKPWIYPYIHKLHHEHKSTVAIATNHAHPLEFIFGNVLPAALGSIILGKRIHLTVVWTWYVFRTLES